MDGVGLTHQVQQISRRASFFFLIIVSLSCFTASYLLLHHGVTQMWERYPLAVAVGYLVFIVLSYAVIYTRLSGFVTANVQPRVSFWSRFTTRKQNNDSVDTTRENLVGWFTRDVIGEIVIYTFLPLIIILIILFFGYVLIYELLLGLLVGYLLRSTYRHSVNQPPKFLLFNSLRVALLMMFVVGVTMYIISYFSPHIYSIGPLIMKGLNTYYS